MRLKMGGSSGLFISCIVMILVCVTAFAPRRLQVSRATQRLYSAEVDTVEDRKKLWKQISQLEQEAVELLSNCGDEDNDQKEKAFGMLAQSVVLKNKDPFINLADSKDLSKRLVLLRSKDLWANAVHACLLARRDGFALECSVLMGPYGFFV